MNDSFRLATSPKVQDKHTKALNILSIALGEGDNSHEARFGRYTAEFGKDATFISIMVNLLDKATDLDLIGLAGAQRIYFKQDRLARLSQARENASKALVLSNGDEWTTNALFALNYSIKDRLDILNLEDETVAKAYETFVCAATAFLARRCVGEGLAQEEVQLMSMVWNAAFINFKVA